MGKVQHSPVFPELESACHCGANTGVASAGKAQAHFVIGDLIAGPNNWATLPEISYLYRVVGPLHVGIR
jgi:hypothetical protein